MPNRIQLRRDTSTNWSSANPVLAEGEIGYNLTLGKFKVGDGTTAWNSLAYSTGALPSGGTTGQVLSKASNTSYDVEWSTTAAGDMTKAVYDTNNDGIVDVAASANSILAANLPSSIDAAKIANGSVSNTEFQYLDGVTSAIQTQLNAKQASLTNPVTGTGTLNELTYFNATGSTVSSLTTATYPSLTELSYVKGVTSALQTQINGKQASLGFTAENVSNKDTDGTLASNSDTKYPSQKAVKTYADTKVSSISLSTSSVIHSTPVSFTVTNGAATGTLNLATQNKNKFLAGPTTGSDATPTFRVIDPADMPVLSYNRQTASYTLVLTDYYKVIEMNVATSNNLTVPLNSSVAFPIGTQILVTQYGAGQTTIVATSGVTLRSDTSKLKISAQYCGAALLKVGTDEWYVLGALTA
jgi:hypothetical protein